MKDADGERVLNNARLRKASRDEKSANSLTSGEEARVYAVDVEGAK